MEGALMKLSKKWLKINNADRMVVYDPERDTLADVLRRIGLTGTKIGCGTGICGACSVILDGKVVRSCTRKLKTLAEFANVITIEGIGTPMNLHPIQRAFIAYGSVQCGICSPGFIVSSYALLQQNKNPSRTEVRAWFQKHYNICRCTGYKQIVNAVMAAAKVMRGEMAAEDLDFKVTEKGYYNTTTPRPSALAKVCGTLDYGEDMSLKMPPGTLHGAVVQPRVGHHAKILEIDYSEAEKMPGVVKVVTAKDVKGNNLINQFLMHKRATVTKPNRPIFVDKTIFRYGDVVAVVLADTKDNARAAAKMVKVKTEPLPEYLNFLDAVVPDAMQIHEEAPNIYIYQPLIKGESADEIIKKSKYSVEASFRSPREPHLSIEGDIIQAYWDEDDILTVHCKSQAIQICRANMAKGIGLPIEKLRLVHNGVGGSFGWSTNSTSFAIAAVCAMAVDKPISLVMSYEEFMHFSGKRTPAHMNGRLSCDEKGYITALEYDVGVDHGAYSELADTLMGKISLFGNPYRIPNVRGLARMAYTNHNVGVAYRGYGHPQTSTAMEGLVDMLAEKAGIDQFEFREMNVVHEGDLSINNRRLHQYPYQEMMEAAKPYYLDAKKRAKEETTEKLRRGIGITTCYFKPLAGPFDKAEVYLELLPNGKIRHYNTWADMGQGGDAGTLVLTLEALKPLGLKPQDIELLMCDSKLCPDTGIAASSRSHYMAGNATINAAEQLLNAMRKEDGSYRTYEQMIAEGIPVKYTGFHTIAGLNVGGGNPNTGEADGSPTGMYGVCLAEVAVDTETGKTKVLSMKMWADAGVVGNKLAAEGQAYGGMSHTIGYALSEDYDDVKRHDNIIRAGIPLIEDVPDDMEVFWHENPRPDGPFGSSGLSELFQNSQHMAVINGIYNATGVRIFELPAYPEKVKAGLEALKRGEKINPPQWYFLGSDLYDELENLANNPIPLGEK